MIISIMWLLRVSLLSLFMLWGRSIELNAKDGLGIHINTTNGAYSVFVDNLIWLQSSDYALTIDGISHNSSSTLKLLETKQINGSDKNFGEFYGLNLTWSNTKGTKTTFITSFRAFKNIQAISFDQYFPDGANGTKSGANNNVGSAFPSFFRESSAPFNCHGKDWCVHLDMYCAGKNRVQLYQGNDTLDGCKMKCVANPNCNCLSFAVTPKKVGQNCRLYEHVDSLEPSGSGYSAYVRGDLMTVATNDNLKAMWYSGSFPDSTVTTWHGGHELPGGIDGGTPLIIFNESLRTVILSPLQNFMASGHGQTNMTVSAGLFASIEYYPTFFSHSSILFGGYGITKTMMGWGNLLLKKGNKQRTPLPHPIDLSLNMLGYWTDNGAWYHYFIEPKKTAEQVMLAVKADWESKKIPARYFQFDSWWYPKEGDPPGGIPIRSSKGMVRWEPVLSVFPDGLKPWLDLPVFLHSRIFAPSNIYTDKFKFICDGIGCLPQDETFFEYILAKVSSWKPIVYEQDWMNKLTKGNPAVTNSTSHGRNWLLAMGRAAEKRNVSIQYCMVMMPHLLQSTAIQSVTQARASGDYNPGGNQWSIGRTSLLYWALGIVPSKDTFFTNITQPGCPHDPHCTEPNTDIQTLISVLSMGPVGPGDRLAWSNASLILRTCRTDGILLRPDRPLLPVESTYTTIFQSTKELKLWETVTEIPGSKARWHYVIGVSLPAHTVLTLADLDEVEGIFLAYNFYDHTFVLMDNSSLTLNCTTKSHSNGLNFTYYVIAPRLAKSGWTFLGQIDKFVSASKQRVVAISDSSSSVSITLKGAVAETFVISLLPPNAANLLHTSCTADKEGNAILICQTGKCKC